MESILYHVMTGAKGGFERQTILGNNLANANTPGFKADLYAAQSTYLSGPGVGLTAIPQQLENGHDMSPGSIITTGGEIDVAIDGDGWFAVQDSNGQEGYTQNGSFRINQNGQLITGSGKLVLGDGGPISIPPAQKVEIGNDGTISVVPLNGDANSLAVIDRLKMVRLAGKEVQKTEEGLFRPVNGGVLETDASIQVITGALNGSNVNAVESMVSMIEANREYEANMKLMQSADENQKRLAQLLQE